MTAYTVHRNTTFKLVYLYCGMQKVFEEHLVHASQYNTSKLGLGMSSTKIKKRNTIKKETS